MKKVHDKPCRICNKSFDNASDRIAHEKICRRQIRTTPTEEEPPEFIPTRSVLNGLFSEYDLAADSSPDYSIALQNSLGSVGRLLKQLVGQHKSFKYYMEFEAVMKRVLTGFEDEFSFW